MVDESEISLETKVGDAVVATSACQDFRVSHAIPYHHTVYLPQCESSKIMGDSAGKNSQTSDEGCI